MTVADAAAWLNAIAPFDSAEGFDNCGLLLGDAGAEVTSVLFGMDLTEALADEAIAMGADLIITHHPFLFHAVKRIDYTSPQGRTLGKLMTHGIAVIAAHTNWDKAEGGVSDSLAEALGLSDVHPADDYVRAGTLPAPLSPEAFSLHVKDALHITPRLYGDGQALITAVAAAGGAYGEGYEAAIAAGAQVFVVGEIAHHEILDACARGLLICEAGHYPTELPGVKALFDRFRSDLPGGVRAHLTATAPYAGALQG